MKMIINNCWGGWSISDEACKIMFERTGKKVRNYDCSMRNDPELVRIVEELGTSADGLRAKLSIEEVPDEYDFWVEDYDGMETVHLNIKEETLRNLIREGDEDKIVSYVMNAG